LGDKFAGVCDGRFASYPLGVVQIWAQNQGKE